GAEVSDRDFQGHPITGQRARLPEVHLENPVIGGVGRTDIHEVEPSAVEALKIDPGPALSLKIGYVVNLDRAVVLGQHAGDQLMGGDVVGSGGGGTEGFQKASGFGEIGGEAGEAGARRGADRD